MTPVEDFLRDVIDWAADAQSPRADRAAMFASDLLAKMGAAKEDTCLARAMGFTGPTGEVIVSSVAQTVLTRAADALREYGADVDLSTITAGLAAAARIIRTQARAEHGGCAVFMMRGAVLAPKHISKRLPKLAQPVEPFGGDQ